MAFGLTDQGFNPARLEDVREAIVAQYRRRFGQNVRVDDESVNGQLIGLFSEAVADLWEVAEDVYTAAYPGSATKQSLRDLVALAGISANPATFSTVALTLTGTSGTPVPAGTVFRDPNPPNVRWVSSEDVEISGGTATVAASPETSGPVVGLAGTITEVVTPVSGLTAVTNQTDAELGQNAETDAALRTRFRQSFRIGGGSSVEAVRATVLNLDGVTECLVTENDSDQVDSDGRPPRSFEVVVRGGTDQEILDAIWLSKPAGITAYGVNVTGTTVDSTGAAQTVRFTRPVAVDVYIEVVYQALDDAPVDLEGLAQTEILEFGSGFTAGQDVLPFRFVQNIETVGFRDLQFRVGLAPNPLEDEPLAITPRQIADFDSTRVAFVRTN